MKNITEQIQDNIHLTTHQKAILATIEHSNGVVPDDVIASDRNLAGAMKQMIKLGLIINAGGDKYTSTKIGRKFAKNENIIDDLGDLTEDGKKMVIGNNTNESYTSFIDYLIRS